MSKAGSTNSYSPPNMTLRPRALLLILSVLPYSVPNCHINSLLALVGTLDFVSNSGATDFCGSVHKIAPSRALHALLAATLWNQNTVPLL